MWDVREAGELAEEVEALFPGRQAAGEFLGISAMFTMAFNDLPTVAGVALVLVTLLSILDLRRPLMVVGALVTLVAGMVWGLATVRAADVRLSMVNIAGLPILLGIGVDVVIHLLHRLQEEGPGGIRRALRTTGVAALVSTMTTVGSFFSLTFAGNRGVRGLGLLVVFGLITVTIVAMTLLPLVWSAGWKLSGKAPADQAPDPGD
jgi:Predicted exporters of the RND superfamily